MPPIGRRHFIRRVGAHTALLSLLLAAPVNAQTDSDVELESYRAHLAAAEKAIRLDEGPEARRWLDAAPGSQRGWEWAYLDALADESLRAFPLPEKAMTAFTVATDGRQAAGADIEGRVYLWTLPDFALVKTIEGHTDAVYSVAFDPDGDRLLTVSRDVTARVWNRKDGKELARLQLDNPGVAAVAFSPDGKSVATCSWTSKEQNAKVRGVVWIWNPQTGEVAHRELVGIKPLDSIAYAPGGGKIVVGSWDGLVHVLDGDGSEVRKIELPDEGVYNAVIAVAVSPDGKWVAAGSKDRTARVWNLETGELAGTLRSYGGYVNDIAFGPDGKRLATASVDASVRIWEWEREELVATLRGHLRSVDEIEWATSPSRLFTISRDKTSRLWAPDAQYGGRLDINIGTDGAYTAAMTPDGTRIAVATYEGRVMVFDAHTGKETANWVAHEGSSCNTLSIAGDGGRLLTCSWDKTARLWDTETQALVRTFAAGEGVTHCAISADGARAALAVGSDVQLWDARSGGRVAVLKGHEATVQDVAFSPNGNLLASASNDKTVRIWNTKSRTEQAQLAEADAPCSAVAFSSDGGRLASGDDSGAVRLWEIQTGKMLRLLLRCDSRVNRLAFTPDGTRVAAASAGVDILDVKHGGSLLRFHPHTDTVWHLTFSPDGKRLASCSWNGTIAVTETIPLRERMSRESGGR